MIKLLYGTIAAAKLRHSHDKCKHFGVKKDISVKVYAIYVLIYLYKYAHFGEKCVILHPNS